MVQETYTGFDFPFGQLVHCRNKPHKRKAGNNMTTKLLKPYKNFEIEKSYDENANGTIDKNTVVYTAYDSDGDLYDAAKTLSGLKKKIDNYFD